MPIKNLFTCFVHEKPDVIWDTVRCLRCLDPASDVLLYNNSGTASLLNDARFREDPHVFIHPAVGNYIYGTFHEYMLDCMEWAFQNVDFDTITQVDSDQMLLRRGYTERLTQIIEENPNLGMLQSPSATPVWPTITGEATGSRPFLCYPQRTALREFWDWRPFLARYEGAVNKFPLWTFWPATVFSRQASQAMLDLFKSSRLLQNLLKRTQIFATEEVLLPTLVDALGFNLVRTPLDETCVCFRVPYTVDILKESLAVPDRFWMHSVPRDLNGPLRVYLREYYGQYRDC